MEVNMKVAIGSVISMGLAIWLGTQTVHLVSSAGRQIVQMIDRSTK